MRIVASALCFLILIFGTANCSDDLHSVIFEAQQLRETEEYQTATELLIQYSHTHENTFEIYNLLGWCHTEQKNYLSAINAFKEALALRPGDESTLLGLVTAYYEATDFTSSLEYARKALNLFPANTVFLEKAILSACGAKEYELSIQFYNKLTALQPDTKTVDQYSDIINNAETILHQKVKDNQNKEFSSLYNQLLLKVSQLTDEQIMILMKLIYLSNGSAEHCDMLGIFFKNFNKPVIASLLFQRAFKLSPDSIYFTHFMQQQIILGRYSEIKNILKPGKDLVPTSLLEDITGLEKILRDEFDWYLNSFKHGSCSFADVLVAAAKLHNSSFCLENIKNIPPNSSAEELAKIMTAFTDAKFYSADHTNLCALLWDQVSKYHGAQHDIFISACLEYLIQANFNKEANKIYISFKNTSSGELQLSLAKYLIAAEHYDDSLKMLEKCRDTAPPDKWFLTYTRCAVASNIPITLNIAAEKISADSFFTACLLLAQNQNYNTAKQYYQNGCIAEEKNRFPLFISHTYFNCSELNQTYILILAYLFCIIPIIFYSRKSKKSFDSSNTKINGYEFIAITLLTIISAVIRIYLASGSALSADELITYSYAVSPDLVQFFKDILLRETHPPFYYLLTYCSVHLLGKSVLALKLPVLFSGIFSVPLYYYLSRQFMRRNASVFGSFLMAFSPFTLHYSQEARNYSVIIFLTLLNMLFFAYLLKNNFRSRHLILWSVSSILLLYTFYFSFFILVAQNLFLLIHCRKFTTWKRWIAANCFTATSILPWLAFASSSPSNPDFDGFVKEYFFQFLTKKDFIDLLPTLYHFLFMSLDKEYLFPLLLIVILILPGIKKLSCRRAVFFLITAFTPPLLLICITLCTQHFKHFSMYQEKYAATALPGTFLLISFCIFNAAKKFRFPVIFIILLLLCKADLFYTHTLQNRSLYNILDYIKANTSQNSHPLIVFMHNIMKPDITCIEYHYNLNYPFSVLKEFEISGYDDYVRRYPDIEKYDVVWLVSGKRLTLHTKKITQEFFDFLNNHGLFHTYTGSLKYGITSELKRFEKVNSINNSVKITVKNQWYLHNALFNSSSMINISDNTPALFFSSERKESSKFAHLSPQNNNYHLNMYITYSKIQNFWGSLFFSNYMHLLSGALVTNQIPYIPDTFFVNNYPLNLEINLYPENDPLFNYLIENFVFLFLFFVCFTKIFCSYKRFFSA